MLLHCHSQEKHSAERGVSLPRSQQADCPGEQSDITNGRTDRGGVRCSGPDGGLILDRFSSLGLGDGVSQIRGSDTLDFYRHDNKMLQGPDEGLSPT
ncbi:hypothetical protein JOB18_029057 [Solea senegalensis]|uniref:Uncharacterized protein n=1 Tax=Solea senegalensis TaxID=28829 RepID=A0AAV6Q2Z1_SOLSE|nr:hypothetical protein JOB18_029057 [Solea senegalensis]